MSLKAFISKEEFQAPAQEAKSLISPQGRSDGTVHLTVESTPEMDTAAKGIEDTAGELKSMQDATVALEQYADLLRQYQHSGVSQQSAAFMLVGLKQHQKVLHTQERPSLEAFGGSYTRGQGAKISLGGIEVDLKELGKAIMELFRKAKALAMELFQALTQNTDALRSKLSTLRQQLPSTSSRRAPHHAKITVDNAALLFVDRSFVGQDITALMEVAKILTTDYPIAADNYLVKLAQILKRYPGTSARACWDELKSVEGPGSKYSTYQGGKPVYYPGNAYFASVAGSRREQSLSLDEGNGESGLFGQGLSLQYAKVNQDGGFQVTVDTIQVLTARFAQFERLLNLMDRVKDGSGKLDHGFNTLSAAVAEFDKKADGQADVADAEKVIRRLGNLSSITGAETSKAYRYLWRAAGTFFAVLRAEVNEYAD